MDVLDVPVAPDDLVVQRDAQAEVLEDEPLEFTGTFALCSARAHGTEEFPDRDAWAGFVETDEVTAEFVQPDGGFQSEVMGTAA